MPNHNAARDLVAHKSPLVLAAIAETVPEPYRTLLICHGSMRIKREVLCSVRLADVTIVGKEIRIAGAALGEKNWGLFQSYLVGYLSRIESEWLFPLPSDPQRPASIETAKSHIEKIIHNKMPAPTVNAGAGLPPMAE